MMLRLGAVGADTVGDSADHRCRPEPGRTAPRRGKCVLVRIDGAWETEVTITAMSRAGSLFGRLGYLTTCSRPTQRFPKAHASRPGSADGQSPMARMSLGSVGLLYLSG